MVRRLRAATPMKCHDSWPSFWISTSFHAWIPLWKKKRRKEEGMKEVKEMGVLQRERERDLTLRNNAVEPSAYMAPSWSYSFHCLQSKRTALLYPGATHISWLIIKKVLRTYSPASGQDDPDGPSQIESPLMDRVMSLLRMNHSSPSFYWNLLPSLPHRCW